MLLPHSKTPTDSHRLPERTAQSSRKAFTNGPVANNLVGNKHFGENLDPQRGRHALKSWQ